MSNIKHFQSVDFTNLEFNHQSTMSYGKRVGFVDPDDKALLKTNPRGKIGKFGIRYHSWLSSFFHQTITIDILDAVSLKNRSFYLNKKSTVRWLNSQLPNLVNRVDNNTSSENIINKINGLRNTLNAQRLEEEKILKQVHKKTYPPSITKHPTNNLIDRLKALVWNLFARLTNLSWRMLRLRFAMKLREKTLENGSKILACSAYLHALKRVPAYQKFVKANTGEIKNFSQIPVTSKDNYIKPALKNEQETSLYLDGRIPLKSKRDTSTGTSGPSTPWYRGVEEQEHVERMTTFVAKVVLGNRPYSFINGFAMGPWATGVTSTLAMNANPQSGIAVIGPNIEEIYSCIKEQARIFGNEHPIIVCGYPPHIRAVVEKAVNEGFPMHNYLILGVVGGEAMSEDLRDLLVSQWDEKDPSKIKKTGLKQCYSSYGASDLDINIGYESDFEIEVRKLCHDPKNKGLAEELFGKNEFIPMIFHYDPLNYHIESDDERHLYYTCVRDDRISPRVRYDLGDIGKTMPVSEVLATLKKHGIELKNKPNTNLPLLFIWGRQGAQISFRGCKLAPENLGETIRRLDGGELPGLNRQIAHYGFYQYTDKGRMVTEILMEFNNDTDYQAADKELLKKIIDKLSLMNADFLAQIAACPADEKPVFRVFKRGDSPMDVQQKKYPMRKKQYIFVAGDEFIPTHAHISPKGKLIKL